MSELAEVSRVALERGPLGLVGYLGQGYADKVQTPEGIASTIGEVCGTVAGTLGVKNLLSPEGQAGTSDVGNDVGNKVVNEIENGGSKVPGRVKTRINIAKGRTKTTPLRKTGYPVSAGFEEHVIPGHFYRPLENSRSIFTITPDELKVILQSKRVVSSPVTSMGEANILEPLIQDRLSEIRR